MPAKHTLHVALNETLVSYVRGKVAAGHHATASDLVRQSLHRLMEADHPDPLESDASRTPSRAANIGFRAGSAEDERRLALDSYAILDTPAEAGYDDIVILACQICDTPVALVSFVAGDRQWFKARIGLDACETPLDQSVCRHALAQTGLLVIPDLTLDPRTRQNSLVTAGPRLRFYAGARLETPQGVPLGTLCVIDTEPRPAGLTLPQARALEALARQVMSKLEMRRMTSARDRAQQLNDLISNASGDCTVVLDLDGHTQFVSPGGIRSMEIANVDAIIGLSWLRVWQGSDHIAAREAVREARTGRTGHFQGFCRTHKGTPKWWDVVVSPLPGLDGQPERLVSIGRDITDLKRAEDEARQLAGVVEQSTDFIAAADPEGRILFVNPAGLRLVGLPDLDAARRLSIVDLFGEEQRSILDDAIMPAVQENGFWEGELNFRNVATGALLPVLYNIFPLRDADGGVTGYGTVTRDRRERRRSYERRAALLELGDRLRVLDDPARMAYAAAEILGRTLGVSRVGYGTVEDEREIVVIEQDWTAPGVVSIAGTHAFRNLGSHVEDLRAGAVVAIDDVALDERTAAHAATLTAIGIRSVVYIPVFEHGRFEAILFVHGATVRAWSEEQVAFARNVTDRARSAIERRKAELRLQELNDDLERRVEARTRERNRLWETTNDLMATAGLDGYLKEVNPAWTAVLGWTEQELLTRPFLQIINPADHAATLAVVERLAAGEEVSGFVDRVLRKDGSERTIMWTAVPDGPLFYIVGRDLTEQRNTEDQLRQSQKMEAVGQLTGGVAHDFNNLLTVIRSSVDLLKRPSLAEDRRQRYIEAISDTATRAAKLTGQLLAFARRQALKPEVFDVAEAVRAIGDMVVTLTGSRVRIDIDVPHGSFFVNADRSQFDTAIVNLAVNARDAMDGEGTLRIAVGAAKAIPALRAHPEVRGNFVSVSVGDTGSGIAVDAIDRIFEPFFTTKAFGQGTGLGLSQVFGFVKQSGGDVVVTSKQGHGATFTLYLPQVAETRRRTEAPAMEPLIEGHGTCVLVVEDNEQVGLFAIQTLEELGYRSVLATDGPAALVELAVNAARFDVVFSDVVMPGMSGIELAQEIRRRHPDLPIVLTSGYSHVLAQNGSYGFELLHKPYSIEQLSRVLQKATNRRRLKEVIDG